MLHHILLGIETGINRRFLNHRFYAYGTVRFGVPLLVFLSLCCYIGNRAGGLDGYNSILVILAVTLDICLAAYIILTIIEDIFKNRKAAEDAMLKTGGEKSVSNRR